MSQILQMLKKWNTNHQISLTYVLAGSQKIWKDALNCFEHPSVVYSQLFYLNILIDDHHQGDFFF
jgi:hypothetical protein